MQIKVVERTVAFVDSFVKRERGREGERERGRRDARDGGRKEREREGEAREVSRGKLTHMGQVFLRAHTNTRSPNI